MAKDVDASCRGAPCGAGQPVLLPPMTVVLLPPEMESP